MNQVPDTTNGQYVDQTEEAKRRAREEEAAAQARMRQYQPDMQPTYSTQNMGASQQAQGGIDPGMALQIGSKFWGGSASTGGTAAVASEGVGGAAGGSTAGGSAASSASGGLAAAGPWAALAAVIAANETWQKKTGNRREGAGQYKDMLSGAVLRQDSERYAKHLFKDDMSGDKIGIGGDMNLGADFGSPMTFKKIPEDFKHSSIVKLVKKIF